MQLLQKIGLLSLILLFAFAAQAQPPIKKYDVKNYEKEWADIEKLENEGLPKSAMA
jgi:hypothetical protein